MPVPLLVSLVTYNELGNIQALIPRILSLPLDAEALVVDDNSPDGTGRWCAEWADREPRLHVIVRSSKLGIGTANVEAMQFACAGPYAWLITLDADQSHDPKMIPALLARAGDTERQTDVVIGSRYAEGGRIVDWPLRRRITSHAVNAFARWILGLPVRDCSSGFRCYRVALLQQVAWNQIRNRGFAFYEEILWHLKRHGASMAEVPIVFADREQGRSKASFRETASAVRDLLGLGFRAWCPIGRE